MKIGCQSCVYAGEMHTVLELRTPVVFGVVLVFIMVNSYKLCSRYLLVSVESYGVIQSAHHVEVLYLMGL